MLMITAVAGAVMVMAELRKTAMAATAVVTAATMARTTAVTVAAMATAVVMAAARATEAPAAIAMAAAMAVLRAMALGNVVVLAVAIAGDGFGKCGGGGSNEDGYCKGRGKGDKGGNVRGEDNGIGDDGGDCEGNGDGDSCGAYVVNTSGCVIGNTASESNKTTTTTRQPTQQPMWRGKAKATAWSFATRHFPDASSSLRLLMQRCCHLHKCLNELWGAILGLIAVDCYQQQTRGKYKDDDGVV
jgi:hypothetical protein